MTSFEDLVLQKTITDKGLRPDWAGHILAALGHADGWGRGQDGGLTPEELGILHCIQSRVEGRVDENDSREYSGTVGLLGWVLKITLDNHRIAECRPAYRELVAEFNRTLRAHEAEAVRLARLADNAEHPRHSEGDGL